MATKERGPCDRVLNSAVADMLDVVLLPPCHLTSIMATVAIYCVVSGDGPDKVFNVKISQHDTVASLRDMVREKNPARFKDIDVAAIQLFKVSLSMADLEQAQDPRKVNGVQELSSPFDKISDHFQDLPDDKVHVIALAPTGERRVLACHFSRLMDSTSSERDDRRTLCLFRSIPGEL